MDKQMSKWGIGPKMALITLPYIALTIIIHSFYKELFGLSFIPRNIIIIIAFVLLIAGIIFYLFTVKTFFKGYKEDKLITTGTYACCRNPIYAVFILFFVPAISLFVNSWLCLTTSVFLYIVFKIMIKSEYEYLKNRFGDEYVQYEKKVNELIPFPG